jgi:hypothetical protein
MDLLENPFYILSASPQDKRERLFELAEQRSFILDSTKCLKARSNLTNPRKRLSAEVTWLPGIKPKRAIELLYLLKNSPDRLFLIHNLSPITRINLLIAAFLRLKNLNSQEFIAWTIEIVYEFDNIISKDLILLINNDRTISHFPQLNDLTTIDFEIKEQRKYYCKVIKSILDAFKFIDKVNTLSEAIRLATKDGHTHGPILLDDLIDAYEVEAQVFLDKEEKRIKILISSLIAAVDAGQSDSSLSSMVNQILEAATNWNKVAYPVLISAISRGIKHQQSLKLAFLIRNVAFYMLNKHYKFDFSSQLIKLLQQIFGQLSEITDIIEKDIAFLNKRKAKR